MESKNSISFKDLNAVTASFIENYGRNGYNFNVPILNRLR